jgi:hypothetical protein
VVIALHMLVVLSSAGDRHCQFSCSEVGRLCLVLPEGPSQDGIGDGNGLAASGGHLQLGRPLCEFTLPIRNLRILNFVVVKARPHIEAMPTAA